MVVDGHVRRADPLLIQPVHRNPPIYYTGSINRLVESSIVAENDFVLIKKIPRCILQATSILVQGMGAIVKGDKVRGPVPGFLQGMDIGFNASVGWLLAVQG